MSIWEQFKQVWKEMPSFYTDKLWRWMIGLHRPIAVDIPVCYWCRKAEWPCDEYEKLTRDWEAIKSARTKRHAG